MALQTCYSGYFGNAWWHPPKAIILTWRKINSIAVFFLITVYKTLQSDWPTVIIWTITAEPQFCLIQGLWWNIFRKIFRLFPEKARNKNFCLFCPWWGEKNFPQNSILTSFFFNFAKYHCNKLKKLISRFQATPVSDRPTDQQIDQWTNIGNWWGPLD